jgi:hypothetical protein
MIRASAAGRLDGARLLSPIPAGTVGSWNIDDGRIDRVEQDQSHG